MFSLDYYDYVVEERMSSSNLMISTTRRPMISTTRMNKIKQEDNVAVPIIRSVFPETWILDFINDTGYFVLL